MLQCDMMLRVVTFCRMEHLGIKVKSMTEEEYCLIPMGGVLPKFPQRTLGIGGTGGMVHPSTGKLALLDASTPASLFMLSQHSTAELSAHDSPTHCQSCLWHASASCYVRDWTNTQTKKRQHPWC